MELERFVLKVICFTYVARVCDKNHDAVGKMAARRHGQAVSYVSCARTGNLDGARHRVALSLDGAAPPVQEVAADSPGASVAADLAAGEHGGPRQAAFAMAKKAGTTLQLCFTKVDFKDTVFTSLFRARDARGGLRGLTC